MENSINYNLNFTESTKKLKEQMSKNNLSSKFMEFKEKITKSEDGSYYKQVSYELLFYIRESLYYQLETLQQNIPAIKEVTNFLLTSFHKFSENPELIQEHISILEKIYYLFIFHFNVIIINQGMKILNFLLNELDYDFHRETLQKKIKIIHILKLKKSVNATVCNKIITNLSLALNLILQNSSVETRKCFYDYVSTNSEDFLLIWFLCQNSSNEMNFSKIFSIDQISTLIEKYSKELEKTLKLLEAAIQNFKLETSVTNKNKIKQCFDIIGMISKIIDSFNIRGNRSYNFDKLIKMNLIPILKRFWNVILFVNESQIYEIDFAVESIQSISILCDNVDCMKFDILLPLLNWIGKLLEKNTKYLVSFNFIVKLISKSNVPQETVSDLTMEILEILEKILFNVNNKNSTNKERDQVFKYYIVMILDSLEKFSNHSINIRDELKFCKEFYASIKEGKLTEEINSSASKKSSEMFAKEYKSVLNNNSSSHNLKGENDSNPSFSNNKISLFENSLNKYEEFKNSLKSIYNLHNRNLIIDNKIRNFIEKENSLEMKESNLNLETFENFYLETSIEMFREIFGYQK